MFVSSYFLVPGDVLGAPLGGLKLLGGAAFVGSLRRRLTTSGPDVVARVTDTTAGGQKKRGRLDEDPATGTVTVDPLLGKGNLHVLFPPCVVVVWKGARGIAFFCF